MSENLKVFLGDKLYEKHSIILPLLNLCDYRLEYYRKTNDYSMIFNTELSSRLATAFRTVLYPFVYVRNYFAKKNSDNIMLSATILSNNRYVELIKQLQQKYGVVQTNTLSDVNVYRPGTPLIVYFNKLFGIGQPQKIICGFSVTGSKLKKAIIRWMDFCIKCQKQNSICTDDYTSASNILKTLETEYSKRLSFLSEKLKKSNISVYITINQYNIRDLLLIEACRKSNIRTKQFEHHASRFMHNVYSSKKIDRLNFVEDICCWNNAEVDFHHKWYNYICPIDNKPPNIYFTGNPEISFSEAVSAKNSYPSQKRITFMISGLLNTSDSDSVDRQLNLRKKIFRNLSYLSEKSGYSVLVRYPPNVDINIRKNEQQYLTNLGFDISPSDRTSLLPDICGSSVVIGTISSVLGLSALMGKEVYQISDENEVYYIPDANIHTINVSEISSIPLDHIADFSLNQNDFLSINKLVKTFDC